MLSWQQISFVFLKFCWPKNNKHPKEIMVLTEEQSITVCFFFFYLSRPLQTTYWGKQIFFYLLLKVLEFSNISATTCIFPIKKNIFMTGIPQSIIIDNSNWFAQINSNIEQEFDNSTNYQNLIMSLCFFFFCSSSKDDDQWNHVYTITYCRR